jgi:hypothetical protein
MYVGLNTWTTIFGVDQKVAIQDNHSFKLWFNSEVGSVCTGTYQEVPEEGF